jgi:hypothetical protein
MAVELAPRTWNSYLRALTADAEGVRASIQLLPGDAGRLAATPRLEHRLRALSYSQERDAIELDLGSGGHGGAWLRCFVSGPRRLISERSDKGLSLLIFDARGRRTLVRVLEAR